MVNFFETLDTFSWTSPTGKKRFPTLQVRQIFDPGDTLRRTPEPVSVGSLCECIPDPAGVCSRSVGSLTYGHRRASQPRSGSNTSVINRRTGLGLKGAGPADPFIGPSSYLLQSAIWSLCGGNIDLPG